MINQHFKKVLSTTILTESNQKSANI